MGLLEAAAACPQGPSEGMHRSVQAESARTHTQGMQPQGVCRASAAAACRLPVRPSPGAECRCRDTLRCLCGCSHCAGVPRVFTDRDLPPGLQPGEVPAEFEACMAHARESRINISVRAVR